jgi:hypothetical protein
VRVVSIIAVIVAVWASPALGEPQARPVTTRIAEAQVALWGCQDHLNVERTRYSVTPWALPRSPAYRAWVLNRWTLRLKTCRAALREQVRQWNWQAWLPGYRVKGPLDWYGVGRCETGGGGDPNWFHANSSFVSAFGISVREYDNDAAYMGVRPWYVKGQPPPSPWEQYQAAVGHYKRFGDGWSCPGP